MTLTPPIACVVDASVAIKLELNEPDSPLARSLFAHLTVDPSARFLVPEFFYLECGNILWKAAHQRSLFNPAEAERKFASLRLLPLSQLSTASLAPAALTIALAHGLTTYDACYVAAAVQERVPLITADDRLVRKLAGTTYDVQLLGTLTVPPLPTPPSKGGSVTP